MLRESLEERRLLAGDGPPNVDSIVRSDADPLASAEAAFEVTFDEAVRGVDAGDFLIDVGGVSGASIVSVSPDVTTQSQTFTVRINRGSGDGTIGLNLVDDNSIVDLDGDPLGGVGVAGDATGDGSFDAGETYTVSTASVGGTVWDDADGDGLPDAGELGRGGVVVYVDVNGDGVRDADEPFAVTSADDPATTTVDESGRYVIDDLNAGPHDVRVETVPGQRQSSPLSAADGSTPLRLIANDVVPDTYSSSSPRFIVPTPDGSRVIVGMDRYEIHVADRDPIDGTLNYVSRYRDFGTLSLINSVSVHPNGRHIFVTDGYGDAIQVFELSVSGVLAPIHRIGSAENPLLDNPRQSRLSPDGTRLFVYADGTQSLHRYDVAADGSLTLAQTLEHGVDGRSLDYFRALAVSPDGSELAVVRSYPGEVDIYPIGPTGTLGVPQTVPLRNYANGVEFSPDGRNLYVADYYDRIWTVDRSADGTWGNPRSIELGDDGLDGLAISPDGGRVVGTSREADAVLNFSRDSGTGNLTLTRRWTGADDLDEFEDPRGVAVGPDGDDVYVTTDRGDRVMHFRVGESLRTPVAAPFTVSAGQHADGIDVAVAIDRPRVLTFAPESAGPVDATSVDFRVTFDRDVTGVTPAALALFDTTFVGIGGESPSVDSVTGSGDSYVVRVLTPTGQGTVGLTLIDDGSIADSRGNTVGGTGTGSTVAWSDPLMVDSVPPQIVSITPRSNAPIDPSASDSGPVDFFVTFSEPVTGVSADDFAAVPTGGSAASIDAVEATADPRVWKVTARASGDADTLAVTLIDDNTIRDTGDLPLGGPDVDPPFDSTTFDVGPPSISGVVWDDADRDGIRDPGEGGRAGVVVYADLDGDGVRGSDEPSAVSVGDDPTTTDVDESGRYIIDGLSAATEYEIRVDDTALVLTSPVRYPVDDGSLTFDNRVTYAEDSDNRLRYVQQVRLSPDARHVYTVANNGRAVTTWRRDESDGSLVRVQTVLASTEGFGGLSLPQAITFTPDGRFGFLWSYGSDYVVRRDVDTGELSFASEINADPTGPTIDSVGAFSPDGRQYYSADGAGRIGIWEMDPADGTPTLIRSVVDGRDGVSGIREIDNITVTPDGTQVLVHSRLGSGLNIFEVAAGSGRWLHHQTITDYYHALDLAFSADGRFAYVPSGSWRLRVLGFDPTDRTWTTVQTVDVDDIYADGRRTDEIEISEDGRFLYVFDGTANRLMKWSRDSETGTITPAGSLEDVVEAVGSSQTWAGTVSLAFDPAGGLYQTSERDHSLTRFSTVSGMPTPTGRDVTTRNRFNDGGAFGVYNEPPEITGVSIDGSNPTVGDTATFTVSFSEDVSGFDAGDLRIVADGVTGSSIDSVVGGPATYTVSVAAGAGFGTLRLQLIDDDSIVDAAGDSLGGAGDQGGAISDALVVDRRPPVVTSVAGIGDAVTAAAAVSIEVVFSADITGVDADDFELTAGGTLTPSITAVTPIGSDRYRIDVDTSSGDGPLGLNVRADGSIVNAIGLPMTDAFAAGTTHLIDHTPPAIVSLVADPSARSGDAELTFVATFSEPVTGFGVDDFSLTTDGLSDASIVNVQGSGTVRSITVAVGTGFGSVTLAAVDDDTVIDAASNPLGGVGVGPTGVAATHVVARWMPGVIDVTTTVDEVDGDTSSVAALIENPGGTGVSLREAVIAAGATDGKLLIRLAGDTYPLTLSGTGDANSATGDLDIGGDLMIVGVAGQTVIDASAANDRIFDVGSGASLHLTDVTLTGGYAIASDDGLNKGNGGGIRAAQFSDVYLDRVRLVGNRALGFSSSRGGAVTAGGRLTVRDSEFVANTAGAGGGAIYTLAGTVVDIRSSTFQRNDAEDGGAAVLNGESVHVDGSSFVDNNTDRFADGGSLGAGGALSLTARNVAIVNSTFVGNVAEDGGAIHGYSGTSGTVSQIALTGVTIVGNQATSRGGAVRVVDSSSVAADATIAGSIAAGNSANPAFGSGTNFVGMIASGGGNVVDDATGWAGLDMSSGDVVGDPGLGTFGDHGGRVATIPIVAGGAAIDAAAGVADLPARDARGIRRDATPDAGAFEFVAAASPSAPVAADDVVTTPEDTPATLDPTANDTDADGDGLSATILVPPRFGVVRVAADGTMTYHPSADFVGTDRMTYTVDDGTGNSDQAEIVVSVTSVNDPPVGVDDAVVAVRGEATTIDVLVNDRDVEPSTLSVASFTQAASGTVTDPGDGTLVYTSDVGFLGQDSFTYVASDGTDVSDTVTVVVRVESRPTAVGENFDVGGDGTLRLAPEDGDASHTLLRNDSDADGDALIAVAVDPPSHGTLTLRDDGGFDYVADAGFVGVDSFTYAAEDPRGWRSEPATVTLNVPGVDDPPDVVSIVSLDPLSSTFEDTVRFEVTFDEPVTRDIDGYDVVTTGSLAATVTGLRYGVDLTRHVVTVTAAGNAGTVSLVVNDGNRIRDLHGLGLGGPAIDDGVFDASPVYQLEPDPVRDITGGVYLDVDRDGVIDASDPGIAGQTVYVDVNRDGGHGPGEPQAVTAADGTYTLSGLSVGDHVVSVIPSNVYRPTALSSGTVTTSIDSPSSALDLLMVENLTAITGVVFDDVDGDGVRDAGEPGRPGRSVFIDLNGDGERTIGEPLATTAADDPATADVDESGTYTLPHRVPGTHTVVVDSGDDIYDTTPTTVDVTIAAFGDVAMVDFGWIDGRPRVDGYGFVDADGDGVRQPDESGLAGALVTLDLDGDGA